MVLLVGVVSPNTIDVAVCVMDWMQLSDKPASVNACASNTVARVWLSVTSADVFACEVSDTDNVCDSVIDALFSNETAALTP